MDRLGRTPTGPHFPKRFLALVVVAFLALAGGARAAVPDDFFGADGGTLVGTGALADSLATMADGGLQVVRAGAATQVGNYSWSADDQLVKDAAAVGLRWYPFIAYAPGVSDVHTSPDVSDYVDYAQELANRYGRDGYYWDDHPHVPYLPITTYEIWNEENASTFWHPQDDAPERYADLYMAARAAIKFEDPQATVVVGGLALGQPGQATDEIQFLQRMFAHRPDLTLDAVGLHPYQSTVADVYARIAKFRQALDQLAGPQVPIEITEVGWSTLTTPESQRAANLRALAMDLPRSDCNIDRLIPFNWSSYPTGGGTDSTFGIAYTNGSAMPSGQAYLAAAETMRGLSPSPAPADTVKICHPDPTVGAGTNRAGPRVRFRVVRDRRHRRVRVIASCTTACRLRVELFAPRRGSHRMKRVARKRSGLSRRRRQFTFRVPRKARHVQVRVLATGSNGGHSLRKRSVRLVKRGRR